MPFLARATRRFSTAIIFAWGIAPLMASAQFITPPTYPVDTVVGAAPAGIAAGDLNGDGKPDLVVANPNASHIAVFLNKGNGRLNQPVTYATGSENSFYEVALGDFNGDGKLDIAASGTGANGGQITVFLGNGDGTFQNGVIYSDVGQEPGSVVAVDVNGDGKTDLVFSSYSTQDFSQVQVLLGNGDGTFQAPITTSSTQNGVARATLAVGDFNGDSIPDVAMVSTDPLLVFLGKGDGTFSAPVAYTGSLLYTTLAVGDMNNDGKLDIVAATDGAIVDIYLGKGNGQFQLPVSNTLPTSNPQAITLTDLNSDGRLDVVLGSFSGSLTAAMGKGAATLGTAVAYAVGSGPAYGGAIAAADLNGDGHPDVACTNNANSTLTTVFGSRTGKLHSPVVMVDPGGPLVAGDFNKDGNLDVAAAVNFASDLSLFLGNGNGTLMSPANFAVKSPYGLTAADFNGDGNLDVATANLKNISVVFGKGDGTFNAPVYYGSNFNIGTSNDVIAAVDVNGDGKPDLAVLTQPYSKKVVAILLNSGNGSFLPAVQYPVSGSAQGITFGDFNGDGFVDMAANGSAGYVSVFLGNGDGTFQSPVNYVVGNCLQLVAVDVNSDGILDLLDGCGTLAILLGNGDGTFQQAIYNSSALGTTEVAAADFNGDGKIDIVGAGSNLGVYYGSGAGTFNYVDYGVQASDIAVGDFNGDTHPDVAVFNGSGVFILLNSDVVADHAWLLGRGVF